MSDNDIDTLADVDVIRRVMGNDLTIKEIMDMNAPDRRLFARECRDTLRAGKVCPVV
jgi:hypothetical protein